MEKRERRSLPVLALILGGMVALGAVLALIFSFFQSDEVESLYSDPSAPRPWAEKKWIQRTSADPAISRFERRFDPEITPGGVAQEPVSGGIVGGRPPSRRYKAEYFQANELPEPYYGDFEHVRLENGRAPLLGGECEIVYTGQNFVKRSTLDEPYTQKGDYYPSLKLDLRRFDGSAFDPSSLEGELPDRHLRWLGQTAVNWGRTYGFTHGLRYPKGNDILIGNRTLYDPDTFVRLSFGTGTGQGDGLVLTGTQVPLLSGETILATIELFHGPVDTVRLEAPEAGDEVRTAHFRAQLLYGIAGKPGGVGYTLAGSSKAFTFGVQAGSEDTHAAFGFAFTPINSRDRMVIEAVNASGDIAEFSFRQGGRGFANFEVEMPLEEIREVRFHYRTGAKLLFAQIPLHATPEAHRQVEDLFDHVIPLTRVRNENDWRNQVAGFVQLQHRSRVGNQLPEAMFPLTFEGATVREMLAAYLDARPDMRVHVDETSMALVFDDSTGSKSWWAQWLTNVRRWF